MEFKTISGGKMVSDYNDAALPPTYYHNAINLRNGVEKGAATSCGGNTISSWSKPDGNNDTVCSAVDHDDKLIYEIVRNSNNKHTIVEIDTISGLSNIIFQNLTDSLTDILNITPNTDISSFRVIDGGDVDEYGNKVSKVLIWTDNNTEIRYLNIGKSRKYIFPGASTSVTTDGVCTISNVNIKISNTLRYVKINGAWFKVKSIGDGNIVINGTVANGVYYGINWSYRDFIQLNETILIKAPPILPIVAEYQDDSTTAFNNLRGDMYQFIYAYVYDDNELSAWSVTSAIPIPKTDLDSVDPGSLKDNSIKLTLDTGQRGVKGIKVGFKAVYASPNNYYQLNYIDKRALGLDDSVPYDLNFLNNENYIPIEVSEVTNLDFDHVPITAGCLDILNNGSLVLGDVVDGFDVGEVDISASIQNGASPILVSSLSVFYTFNELDNNYIINVSGVVQPGDVVEYELDSQYFDEFGGLNNNIVDTQVLTVGPSENLNEFAHRFLDLVFSKNGSGDGEGSSYITDTSVLVVGNTGNMGGGIVNFPAETGGLATFTYLNVLRATIASGGVTEAALSLKSGSAYRVGIRYGDNYGRKTPVYYNDSCYVKTLNYHDLDYGFQYIQWSVSSKPPIWATWYSIVTTKNLTHLNTYCGVAENIVYDITKPGVLTIDIGNMEDQAKVLGIDYVDYGFAKGDRFRLLSNSIDGTLFANYFDTEILADTFLSVATGPSETIQNRALTIRKPADFPITLRATSKTGISDSQTEPEGVHISNNGILFEAYSPKKSSDIDDVFYHIGAEHLIQNPGLPNRSHTSDLQDQTLTLPATGNIYGIDCFIKSREMPYLIGDAFPLATLVEDFNLSDYFKSSITQVGTPSIPDPAYRRVRRKATLIHSDPFIPQTNINGLSRVYPGYFRDYDITMGAFRRLINKGTFLQAIHESDSQRIPINASIISASDGATQLGLSSDLLNQGIVYKGGYGLGNNGSAVVDTGFDLYLIDGSKGSFARLGNNGFDDIGLLSGFSTWIHERCEQYKPYINKIKLGYSPFDKEVIISFMAIDGVDAKTVAYSERVEGFSTFYSFIPECVQHIGSRFYSFNLGNAWVHDDLSVNTWYGVNYQTSFDVVFNDGYPFTKICRFIKVFANNLVSPVSVNSDTGGNTVVYDNMFDIDVSTDSSTGLLNQSIDGIYVAPVPMDIQSDGGLFDGLPLRGKIITVSFLAKLSTVKTIFQGAFLGYVKS